MSPAPFLPVATRLARALLALPLLALPACSTLGHLMSPYAESFSCKNSDHGQCIHPDRAYEDARAERVSRSDRGVTRDRRLRRAAHSAMAVPRSIPTSQAMAPGVTGGFAGYRDSVYRALRGLIDQPVTPMLKPPRSVRTLILPYADRQRPDRLYMPRYVYSIVETPSWVVGDYLVPPISPASEAPILGQAQDKPLDDAAPAAGPRR